MPRYVVKWAQEADEGVDSWEFQYSPNGVVWRWVESVDLVDPCSNCYQAVLETPPNVMSIRSRSLSETGVSEWSGPEYLPELSLGEVGWSLVLFGFFFWVCLARLKTKEVY